MKSEFINGTEWVIDDLGGNHSQGEGWNPNGVWCGECSNLTCEGCENKDITSDDLFYFGDDDYNE